ncbi:phage baseplate assembly protein V [Sediminicoccus sp. KRV36]|uniref:phage baseplate assembly protein V n=1 Tax=Sediminicoccus sp. KRV36 TaxID=3133721 RepID=UPI00200F3800|nr:phage baseplate assembly protein V [Sediminicoccus rosea]UPY35908.1 phage baseplate assembly protein V [Sediminicoccus rosea]
MPAQFFGVYRGRIVNTQDPTASGRVQVTVPAIAAVNALWAPVAGPFAPVRAAPQIGATVWVAFEAGDKDHPVVLGTSP